MTQTSNIIFDQKILKKVAFLLNALDHKLRQRIIIAISDAGEINNQELYTLLRIDQSLLSQHIAKLKTAKIISVEIRGQFRYYKISDKYHYFNQKISELVS